MADAAGRRPRPVRPGSLTDWPVGRARGRPRGLAGRRLAGRGLLDRRRCPPGATAAGAPARRRLRTATLGAAVSRPRRQRPSSRHRGAVRQRPPAAASGPDRRSATASACDPAASASSASGSAGLGRISGPSRPALNPDSPTTGSMPAADGRRDVHVRRRLGPPPMAQPPARPGRPQPGSPPAGWLSAPLNAEGTSTEEARPAGLPPGAAGEPPHCGRLPLLRLIWTGLRGPIRYFLALWLDLEHAGNLSRQAPGRCRPSLAVPRRAGAVRTRSQVRLPRQSGAFRIQARCLFLSLVPRLPSPGRASPAAALRPCHAAVAAASGTGLRAVPAPVASPAVVTTAREPTYGGAQPRCHRVGRQVSCAEQPFEVSHIRRPAPARHAGPAPSSARRLEHRAAGFPCWSGARPPRSAAARNACTARAASAGATPGRTTCQCEASRRGAFRCLRQVHDLDHVNPVRQGGVQPGPHVIRIADAGEGDLQVLGLAGRACRGPAGIRDLGMR